METGGGDGSKTGTVTEEEGTASPRTSGIKGRAALGTLLVQYSWFSYK